MSCKYFCDRCEAEMKGNDSGRLCHSDARKFHVEVMTGQGGATNNVHLCHDCVRAIVASSASKKKGVSK